MDLEVPGRGGDLVRGATGGGGPFPGLGDRVEVGEWAPLIPSLARASSFGLFFFRKVVEGFLDGCTGIGTGPGRLWYMRMMFRISRLGSGFPGGGSELRTT